MRVAFDAVTLSAYLHPGATYPQPIDRIPERLKLLVQELEAANAKIIIPTPILSEFLVLADADGPLYLSELANNDVFEIQPFDTVAAVEAARAQAKALAEGDKKSGTSERWQVVKVDRQFIAIAKIHGVTTIYSDDKDVRKLAAVEGIVVKGVGDLPTPPPPAPETGDLFQDDVSSATDVSPSSTPLPPSPQSPDDEQD